MFALQSFAHEDQGFFEAAIASLAQGVMELQGRLHLSGPSDHMSCYVEVVAGAEEALYLMMRKLYDEEVKHGLEMQTLWEEYRFLALEFSGPFAYGFLKLLSGNHVVKYVDPNRVTRRAKVSVRVWPLLTQTNGFVLDAQSIEIWEIDEIIKTGQSIIHRCIVRLKHIKTKIEVKVEGLPKLYLCRQKALQIMNSRLRALSQTFE